MNWVWFFKLNNQYFMSRWSMETSWQPQTLAGLKTSLWGVIGFPASDLPWVSPASPSNCLWLLKEASRCVQACGIPPGSGCACHHNHNIITDTANLLFQRSQDGPQNALKSVRVLWPISPSCDIFWGGPKYRWGFFCVISNFSSVGM